MTSEESATEGQLWCAVRHKAWAEASATGQVTLEGYLGALDRACQDLRQCGLSAGELAQVRLRAKESFLAAKGRVLPLDPGAVRTVQHQWQVQLQLVQAWQAQPPGTAPAPAGDEESDLIPGSRPFTRSPPFPPTGKGSLTGASSGQGPEPA